MTDNVLLNGEITMIITMEAGRNGICLYSFIVTAVCVLSLIECSDGACTFPSDIRGIWISSDKGTLNFTADTIVEYPVNQITVSVNSLSFSCTEQSGDKYLLSSTDTFILFSLTFRAYLCLEIHKISDYKYWYQIGNNIEPTNNERFLVRPVLSTPVNISTGCERAEPYDTSTFNTLVKQGSVETGLAEATCPHPILHTFSAGSLESADGSTNCTNVTIDMCNDRTRMLQTYDPGCDSSLRIASGGVSVCLLDFTNDTTGVTYLHVWNNDTTLENGINRINCYALIQSGDTFTGTLFPRSCTEDQTEAVVEAPGINVLYDTITKTCQDTTESGPDILFYVAVILGGLVLIFIVTLIICITVKTKCRCCRKLCRKKKVGHSDTSLRMSAEEGLGAYAASARRDAVDGIFKARKPIKLGPIIEPYLRPPPKIELLYDIEPRSTSSKAKLDQSLFMSQVSLKCKP